MTSFRKKQIDMKRFFIIIAAVAALSTISFSATGKDKSPKQAQLDTIATVLAAKLQTCNWKFVPDEFTSRNNVDVDFLDVDANSFLCVGNQLTVNIEFMGARVTAMAQTPMQRGRTIAGAAAAVKFNGGLPNYVKTVATVTRREVYVSKNSKTVTLEFEYNVDDSNLDLPSGSVTGKIYIDTRDFNCRMDCYDMNMSGDFRGKIYLF